jgi:nicotinamidase-related amidase
MDALIIVDMQKDFCYENGALYIGEHVKKIFNPLKRVAEFARERMLVIYTLDWHRRDDTEFEIWNPHCIMNTEGAEVIDEIKPDEGDILIKKRRYSAFYATDLDLTLRELKIGRIFITGVTTNICVMHTVSDAVLRNYEVNVLEDCTAALNDYDHEYGIRHMKNVLNAKITHSKDFLSL